MLALLVAFQDPPEKTVVITASPLNPKDVFETPYSMDVILRKDLDEHMPRTLPELLKETSGISIQKTSNGQGSPFIRGFTGFRNVLLIDGIRLNNAAFRDGPNQYWSTVDSYLVDQIEILKGPASVLYGSDAIGGAVALRTRTVDTFPASLEWNARTIFRYATAEQSTTARQELTMANAGGALIAGMTFRDYNDLVAGTHVRRQDNTGYGEYDVDAKVVTPVGPGRFLTLAVQGTRVNEAARTHSTTASEEWHGTVLGTDRRRDFDQERDLVYIQYKSEAVHASLSFHRNAEDSNRITGAGAKEFREFEVTTPAFFARYGTKTGMGFVTAGIEYSRDQVDSDGFNRSAAGLKTEFDRGEIADDATVDLIGAFVQDEIDIDPGWTVTAGLRFTTQRIDAGDVDPSGLGGPNLASFAESYSAFVGSARVLYRATGDFHLIAGISQGFRAPNLDDTTAVRLVLSGQTDFPNPDLDPEYSTTYEIGTRIKGESWDAQAFVFHTQMRDFIGRVPAPLIGPTAFTKDNIADGTVRGMEIAGSWRCAAAWRIWADFTLARGLLDGQPLGKMNPPITHVGVRWQEEKKGPWVEAFFTGADKQEHLSPTDETDTQRIPPGGTPGFLIATLRGGMQVMPNATATLAIENVANKDYRWHGSGTNEPGTNVIAGLDFKW